MKKTRTKKEMGAFETFSIKATEWLGTTTSLIVHSVFFVIAFALPYFGITTVDEMLLVLTTVVSLEAIYLAIFIQMTVNRNNQSLAEVEKEIDEIQEDVDEIGENIDELSEDIDEIQEDIDEIQEDESEEDKQNEYVNITLENIEKNLQKIIQEIEILKIKKQ